MLRLKSKNERGKPFAITLMRFPVSRLVEQVKQKFETVAFETVLKRKNERL